METNENLIKDLISLGYLKNSNIINAFEEIKREDFVPEKYKEKAYENIPLPIGDNQTTSQPLVVAFMLELLDPKKGNSILEIGTGSGWQTALLANMISSLDDNKTGIDSSNIISIEYIPALYNFALENLNKYNILERDNIKILNENGYNGYEEYAPYDRIISGASAEEIPKSWKEQLKIGGIIVSPVKDDIVVAEKVNKNEFMYRKFHGFAFVPLKEE